MGTYIADIENYPHEPEQQVPWGLSAIFLLSIGLMPLASLSLPALPSLMFYVSLVLAAMIWGYAKFQRLPLLPELRFGQHKLFWFCASLYLLTVIIAKIGSGVFFHGSEIERTARYSLGLPLLYMGLRYLPASRIQQVIWGMPIALLFALGWMIYLIWPDFNLRPETGDYNYNAVSYGIIVLVLSFCALYSLGIQLSVYRWTEFIIKLLIALCGFYAYFLTQTRTGLLLMPVLLLIGLFLWWGRKHWWRIVLVALLVCGLAAVLAFSMHGFRDRLELVQQETVQCQQAPTTLSSICIRFQLWHSALDIWKRYPIFGTGADRQYQQELKDYYVPRHEVNQFVADNWGEPHNDYLKAVSSFGLFGLIGQLMLCAVPALYFLVQLLRARSRRARVFAAMGLAFCVGFSMAGFFELMFRGMRTVSFYTEMIVIFFILVQKYNLRAVYNDKKRLLQQLLNKTQPSTY
ncbi:O-antigen ligase family protein [Brackiella oedipodis]|uniref:O-antigen ligase family protein n=1 Tax=Brackiella oedipodis TaxID=124225 RepID=UPI00048DBAB4|nr:O-antigen ligase family protein [Brackiella oedipodis]